jgi:spore coat protein A, manganese oxidase
MTSRREFLTYSALTGIGSLLPATLSAFPGMQTKRRGMRRLQGAALSRYVQPVPLPGVIQPLGKMNGKPYYEIPITMCAQQVHPDLPATPFWGYNGSFPGPTIEARTNDPIIVRWRNDLPVSPHLLTVDKTIHGADMGAPDVRVVTHLHGGHAPSGSDGGPLAWYTSGSTPITGSAFRGDTFEYPNRKQAATLWYHDHAIGITRLNVMAGLAGFYIIRDNSEDNLGLPAGAFEIPLVFQDRVFNFDGTLFYPEMWEPEFFGDVVLVNGKVWPYLDVEPRRYRFRILNGSNSRFYRLRLLESAPDGTITGTVPVPIVQIGSDGGLLGAPAPVTTLLIAPGERADVIIDFTGMAGASFAFENDAAVPFSNDPAPDLNLPDVMQFRVSLALSGPDTSVIPRNLATIPPFIAASARITRTLTLDEVLDPITGMPLRSLLDNKAFDDPISELPQLNTSEVWNLANLTVDTHPIHLHLVQFQVLDRTPFDAARYKMDRDAGVAGPIATYFTGPPMPADPNEGGYKDTVRANPDEVTRIGAQFGDFPGEYVWHCHILEHEDNEMMRPFRVIRGRM